MTTRIITGVCLTAVLAFALAMGGWVFSVLYMASICLSMYEVFRALKQAGHRPVQWPCWLCLVLSIPLFTIKDSVSPLLPLVAGACMLIAVMVMFRSEPRLDELLLSAMPLFCVLLPGMCMLFALLMDGVFSCFAPMPPVWHFLVLGVLGGLAGQVGDLFASLIKRHCGLKDFGTIFPGHGGMMDRLDSVYWATVVMYVYLLLGPFPA